MKKLLTDKIELKIYYYSEWLTKQNRKPKKFIAIINGLSNDLKKINKLEHDQHLFLISNPDRLTELLNEWLAHEPYKAKNERGNNYYSAPFKKYIKYMTEKTN
tara:strand:+ start:263 stop:571 length:309 start_codon:yes stop_codon:yes gene_type:complete